MIIFYAVQTKEGKLLGVFTDSDHARSFALAQKVPCVVMCGYVGEPDSISVWIRTDARNPCL
jgi:hypothetical protein